MDFIERLTNRINAIPDLPGHCLMGYLGVGESFVIYPLPGSKVVQQYMDGTTDQVLNYEIAMKSNLHSKVAKTLWTVQSVLEGLKLLESNNGSFKFEELTITNKPFINQIDEQGWFVFLLDVQAEITVYKEEL